MNHLVLLLVLDILIHIHTLTTIGRFCSYMLIFLGLLFNGLILQELIKGFLKIYREDRRDQ